MGGLFWVKGMIHFNKRYSKREGEKLVQKKLENAAMLSQTWHGVKRYVVYRFKNFFLHPNVREALVEAGDGLLAQRAGLIYFSP